MNFVQRLIRGFPLPNDGLQILAAALLIGLGGRLWTWSPVAGAGLAGGGALLLIPVVRRQIKAERLATDLCEGAAAKRQSLSRTLPRLAARLAEWEHRLTNRHGVTGLPTREHLFHELDKAIEDGCGPQLMGAIRFVDFDRLAAFDRAAADAVLTALAKRLRTATASAHDLAHVDRDCFAVWFRGADPASALSQFRAIVYVATHEIAHGDLTVSPTLETGSACYPQDGQDAAQLLLRATAALAQPEIMSAGEVRLSDPPSLQAAREQFTLEQDLTRAIAEEQLTMVFQPVADLAAGRLTGAEALLRWDHPTLGPISPGRFIPIVEAMGLSERYGLWVLNAACREARRWRDGGLEGLRIAVNLSARQLLDPGLQTKIHRTLERHGLDPSALELELTETAAMQDAARTLELFGQLRATGISLAIDDFGSGYSSLSYLKNLPFNKLKIDREFTTCIHERQDSRAICKALIELGRGMDLLVLAEGVETAAEVEALLDLGCSVFQGYFFSKPLTADQFMAAAGDPTWLASRDPRQRRPLPQGPLSA